MMKSWRKSTSCMASNMLVIAAYRFMSLFLLWMDRMSGGLGEPRWAYRLNQR